MKNANITRTIFLVALLALMQIATFAQKAELVVQTGHSDFIKSITFSPDGKYIASGGADNTIKLWSVDTGQQIKSLEGHTSNIQSIAISPDGKFLASGSADSDNTIRLWNLERVSKLNY